MKNITNIMSLNKKRILAGAMGVLMGLQAQAGIYTFDLLGKAGSGLLSGNENIAVGGTPGTGGEVGAGIFYDDVTNKLTLNVGWGSSNGFTDLTGNATAGHLHGAAIFTANAGVRYGLNSLAGWNNSASSGGFTGVITISAADEISLLAGLLYMNVHTSRNPGGEIRGNLVRVPDSGTSAALLLLAVTGLLGARRCLVRSTSAKIL